MNKVVSIEIAGQVFWVEEQAYKALQKYLQKLRGQLANHEYPIEIYKDIELRLAELLYELSSDKNKAVTTEQLKDIIDQVGFIDDGDTPVDIDTDVPRKSYLDPHNKILGGVCSGLAIRLGVPTFLLRIIFIALTAAFGLGIALYLVFWISLDTNTSRNTILAAYGKAQTAKGIATIEAPKDPPLALLQRIIFLPISILGTLITVINNHLSARKKAYSFIFKNICLSILLIVSSMLCFSLFGFNKSRLFSWFTSWALSLSVMYLIVLGLAAYLKTFYLERPNFEIKRTLKIGAFIPIVMLVAASFFINWAHFDDHSELIEKNFTVKEKQLVIQFDNQKPLNGYIGETEFHIQPSTSNDDQVKLNIHYYGNGFNQQNAKNNTRNIDYFFTFQDDILILNQYWSLEESALRRGQKVIVAVEIPQSVTLNSSLPLKVNIESKPYFYEVINQPMNDNIYRSSQDYFHEYGKSFNYKLSLNERTVLEEKFCEAFFISESWYCPRNILRSVSQNRRFDRAFLKDIQTINQLREYLLPDRSLSANNLIMANALTEKLSIQYPGADQFQKYIEHLIAIKSSPENSLAPDSG